MNLHRLSFWLTCLDDNRRFQVILASAVLLLFAWCVVATFMVQQTYDAVISSGRLVIETACVFGLLAVRRYLNVFGFFFYAVVGLACINSLVVIIQLLEGAGCLAPRLSWIITDFWHFPVNEWTRKPGIFNGVQTSSLLSFFALAMMSGRRDRGSLVVMALCVFPLVFGSRTLLIFVIPYLLYYWRVLLGAAIVLALLLIGGSHCSFHTLVLDHINQRIKPAAEVVINTNPNLDYSTLDLQSHYRAPVKKADWLTGNGYTRYSPEGGQDPAISRWLLQTGVPGLLLIVTVSGLICWRILRKGGVGNALFAVALAASLIKAELLTSTAIYSALLFYGLSTIAVTRKSMVA